MSNQPVNAAGAATTPEPLVYIVRIRGRPLCFKSPVPLYDEKGNKVETICLPYTEVENEEPEVRRPIPV